MIRYRRLGSTLFSDGTLVNDQLLGGAEPLYMFSVPATGPTMSTVLPPAISGANMVRPFLDYEVQVAAVSLYDVGPYSNLSFGSALTAGWCFAASRAPDWTIIPDMFLPRSPCWPAAVSCKPIVFVNLHYCHLGAA